MAISQIITVIPTAGHRGVDIRSVFVAKQEAFQDALTATTVTELNTLATQANALEVNVNAKEILAMDYANKLAATVETGTYSAKEFAIGDLTISGGSAKAWAIDTLSPNGTTEKSAKTLAAEAVTSATSANTNAVNSSASASLAQKWASELENVVVTTGLYSAYHWAMKAAASAASFVGYSTAAPLMNGVASVGISTTASRGDHVHPSDTTKADIVLSIARDSATGAAYIPAGTTAQRPATPAVGYMRFNTTLLTTEIWNGTLWTPAGAGATGGGSDTVFVETSFAVTQNYTITTGKSAVTIGNALGNVTVADGVTITIPDSSIWLIQGI